MFEHIADLLDEHLVLTVKIEQKIKQIQSEKINAQILECIHNNNTRGILSIYPKITENKTLTVTNGFIIDKLENAFLNNDFETISLIISHIPEEGEFFIQIDKKVNNFLKKLENNLDFIESLDQISIINPFYCVGIILKFLNYPPEVENLKLWLDQYSILINKMSTNLSIILENYIFFYSNGILVANKLNNLKQFTNKYDVDKTFRQISNELKIFQENLNNSQNKYNENILFFKSIYMANELHYFSYLIDSIDFSDSDAIESFKNEFHKMFQRSQRIGINLNNDIKNLIKEQNGFNYKEFV